MIAVLLVVGPSATIIRPSFGVICRSRRAARARPSAYATQNRCRARRDARPTTRAGGCRTWRTGRQHASVLTSSRTNPWSTGSPTVNSDEFCLAIRRPLLFGLADPQGTRLFLCSQVVQAGRGHPRHQPIHHGPRPLPLELGVVLLMRVRERLYEDSQLGVTPKLRQHARNAGSDSGRSAGIGPEPSFPPRNAVVASERCCRRSSSPLGDCGLSRGPSSGREVSQNTAASRFSSTVASLRAAAPQHWR